MFGEEIAREWAERVTSRRQMTTICHPRGYTIDWLLIVLLFSSRPLLLFIEAGKWIVNEWIGNCWESPHGVVVVGRLDQKIWNSSLALCIVYGLKLVLLSSGWNGRSPLTRKVSSCAWRSNSSASLPVQRGRGGSTWSTRLDHVVHLVDFKEVEAVHPTAIVPLSSQKEFIQKLTTDFLEKMANEREQEPTRRWDCFLCLIKYQMLKVDCKTRKSSKSIEKLIQMSSTIIASSTSKIRVEKCQWKRPINQQSNKQLNAQTATNVQVESMNQENNGNGSVQPMHNLPASAEPIGQKSAK